MQQRALTVVSPIDGTKLQHLRILLSGIQDPNVERNALVPFSKFKTIHFARFVILDDEDGSFPCQLIFSTDFDGTEQGHIQELVQEAETGLRQLYDCCIGFEGNLAAYWQSHKIPLKAYYNGHRRLSVAQIKRESELRDIIAQFLDETLLHHGHEKSTPIEIKRKTIAYLAQQKQAAWVFEESRENSIRTMLHRYGPLAAALVLVLMVTMLMAYGVLLISESLGVHQIVLYTVTFIALAIGLLLLKRKLNRLESTDRSVMDIPVPKHVKDLMHAENFQVQNQLSHIVLVKPGYFRLWLLKIVLGAINLLSGTVFNKGKLGSIPSIHFARWVMTDQRRRLLFFSNFDGSWENYLGDFVDKAAIGLTAVWSNAENFPRTRNLLQEGATDEHAFKEWARAHQVQTQVWYSAYKTLSVQNINNNAFIRAGLLREMNEGEAQQWLDRIYNFKD